MPHLAAKDWKVLPIPEHRDAVNFITREHYARGAANTSTFRHGLFTADTGELRGVALWIPPTKTAGQSVAGEGWRGVLSLSRLVISPGMPTNSASFLLGRSMALINRDRWPVLLTYADTGEGHTGAIYKATNWHCLGAVPAGDTWTGPDGAMRGRKRGGRTWLASEMVAAGFVRRPSAPKIKFIHPAPACA